MIGGIHKKIELLDTCRVWYEEWKSLINNNKKKSANGVDEVSSEGFTVDFRDLGEKATGVCGKDLKKSGFHAVVQKNAKKLIGKRIASKDLSELSACENKKKLKTCGKDNGLGKDDTFSGEDKNKIKLPFFMIPLKGVQAKVITDDISSLPDDAFVKAKTAQKKGEKKPHRTVINLGSTDNQRPNLYTDYEILRGLKYQKFFDIQQKNNKFYSSNP